MSRSGEGFLGWDVDSVPRREVSYGLWVSHPLAGTLSIIMRKCTEAVLKDVV